MNSVDVTKQPRKFVVLGSVAWDEIISLDVPLVAGSHNGGNWRGGRIGGGAANTAMALARMKEGVRIISAVGDDEAGQSLLNCLGALDVNVDYIHRHGGETTRSLVMLDAKGERTVVNLARAAVPIPNFISEPNDGWLYVRSADPELKPVLEKRVDAGGFVLAHVPPVNQDFRPAQVLVGSASDLTEAFLAAPFSSGRDISGPSLRWMVITDGASGAKAYGQEVIHEAKAPSVEVKDSTGAGDVFAAGLLWALARGLPMDEALHTAVAWGSASVGYLGTVPPEDFKQRVDDCLSRIR